MLQQILFVKDFSKFQKFQNKKIEKQKYNFFKLLWKHFIQNIHF